MLRIICTLTLDFARGRRTPPAAYCARMPLCDDVLAWVTLARAPALDCRDRPGGARATWAPPAASWRASDAVRERAGMPAAAARFSAHAGAAPTRRSAMARACAPSPAAVHRPAVSRAAALARRTARSRSMSPATSMRSCDPQLAVVGSRNPTAQGRDTAFEFAQRLAERGLAITSGLAQGIDAARPPRGPGGAGNHAGGARQRARCGLSARAIAQLSEAIEQQGALISEFPLGTAAAARAISRGATASSRALSLGTLVVEAARGSGSLITARAANELGREVFAVPGSIHNPLSRGCHELIKQGAKLAETADDILSELNFSAFFASDSRAAAARRGAQRRRALGHGQGSQNLVRCARL